MRKKVAAQWLHHVNTNVGGCKKKVLTFRNVLHLPSAFVECFVKVHVCVHNTSNKTCGTLMPHLWWLKAPVQ